MWNEDGRVILAQLIDSGPASIVAPVGGYLVTVARLIAFVAWSASPAYYPLISTLLAWLFIVAVGVAIAVSPLAVRGGPYLALATFFVPSDPEVFGLPLYTFWWAGLLLLLAALWRRGAGGTAWRIAFVAVGGLSSPVIFLVAPLLAYRAIVRRDDGAERATALAAAVCFAIQAGVLLHEHNSGPGSPATALTALGVVETMVGSYAAHGVAQLLPFGRRTLLLASGALTLLLVALALRRGEAPRAFLAYLWFGSIALTLGRNDVNALNPFSAGPRYFFYPFVLEGWFLVDVLASAAPFALRASAGAMLVLAGGTALAGLSRPHDDLRWTANLRLCAAAEGEGLYPLGVHTDGRASSAWTLPLRPATCRALIARDPLARLFAPPPPPYRAIFAKPLPADPRSIASVAAIVHDGWGGKDFSRSRLPGFAVDGSYRVSDADTGALVLRLRRGESVLFRSGPQTARQRVKITERPRVFDTELPRADDWIVLRFDARDLPERFTAVFEDDGTGYGEWSAVALSRAAAREEP